MNRETRADRDEQMEEAVSNWLAATDPRDDRWQAAVDQGLQRSLNIRQRRSLAGRIGSALRSRSARFAAVAGVAAVAVVAVGIGAALLSWFDEQAPPRVGSTPPPAAGVERFVAVRRAVPPLEPVAVVEHAGSLWIANLAGDLYRVDPSTGDTRLRQPLATGADRNACGPMSALERYLWVPLCASGPVINPGPTEWAQVDTSDGQVVRVVAFEGPTGTQLASLGESIWAIRSVASGSLQQIDPERGVLGNVITVGARVTNVVGGFGSLWVSAPDDRAVLRLDPVTGAEVARVGVDGTPGELIARDDGLWVALADERALARIDPGDERLDLLVPLVERPVQVAATDDAIWVLTRIDLMRVDPTSGNVVLRLRVGEHSVSFGPQFTGPTYAIGVGSAVWFVPPRGEMLQLAIGAP